MIAITRTTESTYLVRTQAPLEAFFRIESLLHPAIVNLHPAYASVLVEFDPIGGDAAELERVLRACLESPRPLAFRPDPKLVEIPVRYDGEDLDDVARFHSLTTEEIVRLHSGAEYTVAFLGFQPGFAYLSGLPERIATPRLATPRVRVPAGSVGIAGAQTGVYPGVSPGGWRLVGRTSLTLFDAAASPPALLSPGDRVRFVPVSAGEDVP